MQKLRYVLFLILALFSVWAFNRPNQKNKLQWISLKEAEKAMKVNPKPILIDLYTDWCGWCKVMDKKTYGNKAVADYIQEKFYPVKLNAETRDTISWMGKIYKYNKQYRINEFALYLTGGQLSFPTTIFIYEAGSPPENVIGYLKPSDLEPIVKFVGEKYYKKLSFEDFQKDFKSQW
ncbi:MAG TPA: DUF255 domain-containing protein [Chitinophagaceae bacterium]|nr:DUF255 domain-containing protein [Chitinophagaceae bacterium]